MDAVTALAYLQLGDYGHAGPLLTALAESRRKRFPRGDRDLLDSLRFYSMVLLFNADVDGSVAVCAEVADVSKEVYGDKSREYGEALVHYGGVLRNGGRVDDAIPVMTQAVEVARGVYRTDDPAMGVAIQNLASAMRQTGRLKKAMALNIESYEIARRVYGDGNIQTYSAMNNVASVYAAMGDADAAYKWGHPCYEAFLKEKGPNDQLAMVFKQFWGTQQAAQWAAAMLKAQAEACVAARGGEDD